MALITCRGKADCWCHICHEARLNDVSGRDTRTLLKEFDRCNRNENCLLTHIFGEVLKSVAIAKAFRINAEIESGYKQLKRHLLFIGIENDEAAEVARTLNNAVWV